MQKTAYVLRISDWSSDVCSSDLAQLQYIEGSEARDYLKRRGLSAATAKAFGFGLSPDGRGRLKEALKSHGEMRLIEAGLLLDPDGERESYDRFCGRLMIPVRDARGRVMASGGRRLGAVEPKERKSVELGTSVTGRVDLWGGRTVKA